MSLPRITTELGTVSKLDDRPNDTGGLTAAELKAKFDNDAGVIKDFLNNTLLPYLESVSGAKNIGINTITGLSANEVQSALEQIMTAMQDITQGAVADASITLAKLAAEVTAVALGGAAASHTHSASDIASGTLDAARIPTLSSDKIASGAIIEEKLGAAAVTANKIGAAAVQSAHLAANCVTNLKLAKDAVKLTSANYTVWYTNWETDSESLYTDFPYRAPIYIEGATADMIPEVIFAPDAAMSGTFAPVAKSAAGIVYIYAAEAQTADMIVPTVILWR